VTNRWAGITVFAWWGAAYAVPESPSASVSPSSFGSVIVFMVTRNAVAVFSGLTRTSRMSAALRR
jgi:hypothetical protein